MARLRLEKEPFAVSLARAEDARNLEAAWEESRTRKHRKSPRYPKWPVTTNYCGGKRRPHLRKWVLDNLPTEGVDTYFEGFGGSANILLARPRVAQEVLVERDRPQWALLRTLRDQPERLVEALSRYSEEAEPKIFEVAKQALVEGWYGDEFTIAKCQLVRNSLSVNSKGVSYRASVAGNPGKLRQRPDLTKCVTKAAGSSSRLQGVEILNGDCVPMLAEYDGESTLYYLDPPYLLSTRTQKLYNHEMTDEDHEALLKVLVQLKGKVAISGFDSDLYNDYLRIGEVWRKAYYVWTPVNKPKLEVLWMNY